MHFYGRKNPFLESDESIFFIKVRISLVMVLDFLWKKLYIEAIGTDKTTIDGRTNERSINVDTIAGNSSKNCKNFSGNLSCGHHGTLKLKVCPLLSPYYVGGFPIKIEIQITKLITYRKQLI